MLVVLFSAVIVFLIVNVWDLHRERAGEILEKRQYRFHANVWDSQHEIGLEISESQLHWRHEAYGLINYYDSYGVVFRDAVNRRFEQTTSIAIGLLVTVAFAALLWQKWLP